MFVLFTAISLPPPIKTVRAGVLEGNKDCAFRAMKETFNISKVVDKGRRTKGSGEVPQTSQEKG